MEVHAWKASQLAQGDAIGSGRLWRRYGIIIGRPRLPWLRSRITVSCNGPGIQDPRYEPTPRSEPRSPSRSQRNTTEHNIATPALKGSGFACSPTKLNSCCGSPNPSYRLPNQRLQDILEEISQSEEECLLRMLQMRDRQRSMRSKQQLKLDTWERALPPLPDPSAPANSRQSVLSEKDTYITPGLSNDSSTTAVSAIISGTYELSATEPIVINRSPTPEQRTTSPTTVKNPETPSTPKSVNLRSLHRKYSLSNGSLYSPILAGRRESICSIASMDFHSQRSSTTTLIESEPWPTTQPVELPADTCSINIDRQSIWCRTGYGDKRFRTLPGEAFSLA